MRREFSAGGVVYKREENGERKTEVLFLVRRPTPGENYRGNLGWSLPKGWIDKGEKAPEAALREVREEGGVEARIVEKLKTIKYFFTDENGEKVLKFVTFYLMELIKILPEGFEWETAEVRWVNSTEALEILVYGSEKELVRKSEEILLS